MNFVCLHAKDDTYNGGSVWMLFYTENLTGTYKDTHSSIKGHVERRIKVYVKFTYFGNTVFFLLEINWRIKYPSMSWSMIKEL